MTRETKVGLFVAASFLCLVGVVIAAKLRATEDPADAKALAEAKLTVPTPTAPSKEPAATPPPSPAKIDPLVLSATHTQETSGDPPVPAPPAQTNGSPSVPMPPAIPDVNAPVVPPPVPPPSNVDVVPPPAPQVTESEQAKIKRELANAVKPPAVEAPTLPAPEPKIAKPPMPEAPSVAVQPKPATDIKPPAIEPPSVALNANPQAPTVPQPSLPTPQKPLVPEPPKPETRVTPAMPPVGAPGSLTSGAPQVSEFLIKSYTIQPGDTLRTISLALFASEKYARALHAFNRDYPLAMAGVKADPPRLEAGQAVFYPPVEILQARYASAIQAEAPSRPSISVGTPMPIVTTPGNPNNSAIIPSTNRLAPSPVQPVSDSSKRYRVRDNGEHILQIAQEALGDRRRWTEIYRLNPQIRPDYPIPGGTELRLP